MDKLKSNILMVMVPDRLSELLTKGEIVDRYYNPGEVFDEVHIVMFNDDKPDPALVQRTVGSARLVLHNVAAGKALFLKSLCWRPFLLRPWARQVVELARRIGPALIRCHGAHLNTYAAAAVKRTLGIPYLVSMHINPDEDMRKRAAGSMQKLIAHAQKGIEQIGLLNADLVMPVYRPIVPYLERVGVKDYQVCYNVLNPNHLGEKADYTLHNPIRIISVGRQFREKNPINLIHAVGRIPGVHLTLVGDGTYHEYLKNAVAEAGLDDRVRFHAAISNDQLCRLLPEHDLFAVHSEYWEISKSVLEPLLCGLPLVINRRIGLPVPELTGDICMLVENTVDGYQKAIEELITHDDKREALGRRAFAWALANWSPKATEARFAAIYRQYALR
ncbi:MAG: glycosyltransferase family 4 protein [Proteobacteria bacterium]|nr:glycosyltransferase family 4 protein [Pseudomonadota bacterium]